jgi:hypothetical protein
MKQRTLTLVVLAVLAGIAGCLATKDQRKQPQAASASSQLGARIPFLPNQNIEQAGRIAAGGGALSRDVIPTPGFSSSVGPNEDAPATFHLDAVAAHDALMAEAVSVDEMYLPSRESLQYHIDHHVGQIVGLQLEDVRTLFEGDETWSVYLAAFEGEGTLGARLGMPTPEDADRLWNSAAFRSRFEKYLELDHLSFASWELSQAKQMTEFEDYSDATGKQAGNAWAQLWQTPDIYPHWAFLMECARRLFL